LDIRIYKTEEINPNNWLNELESENANRTAVKTNKCFILVKIPRKKYKAVIHKIYKKL
jgi:hypothetical protein